MPEAEDERHRHEVGLGGHPEGVERDVARQARAQLAGGSSEKMARIGSRRNPSETQAAAHEGDPESGGSHGIPKPAARSSRRPSRPSTEMTKSCAASRSRARGDRELVVDGRLRPRGDLDRAHARRHRRDVGQVHESRIGLAERDLATTPLTSGSRLTAFFSTLSSPSRLAPRACRGRSEPSGRRRRASASGASRDRRRS